MPESRTKCRILVIDDDEAIASMIGQMLRRMGYFALVCVKPLDALAFYSRAPEKFDAVIVDEMMPDIRGTELAARLLAIKGTIPIILMTGHGDKISLEQVRKSGVRATLIKPVLRDRLEIAVASLLKSKRAAP